MTISAKSIAVLLVEDNSADAYLVEAMLRSAPVNTFTLTHVTRLSEAREYLANGTTDVVLLDLSLPDGFGLDTVSNISSVAPDAPIVVMSGNDDDDIGIQGVREGAQDYLVKSKVDSDLLIRSLRYAIERKSAEVRLAAKTREQEAFIYTVAHDLRAPLLSLEGIAGILSADYRGLLDESGNQYVDRIVANAQRMQRLLDDLLELSKIDGAEAEFTLVSLADVVGGVAEQLSHSIETCRAQVHIVGALPVVRAHQTRVTQLFTNLIDNAIKYTPPDRAPLIEIRAIARHGDWEITVTDNGIGIPEEFKDRVLGIFQRLPAGKRLNASGSGIGLAIVQRVIETHGGKLWLDSIEGRGTTIHFTLPAEHMVTEK